MNDFRLNEQIAHLRRKNHMTQEKLAALLGVTNQAVSKWEAGICCPDVQLLPEIAKCFKVSIDALFTADDYETRCRLIRRYDFSNRDEDFEAAMDAFDKVIMSGRADTMAYKDRALLLEMRGNRYLNQAKDAYEKALQFDTERGEAYYQTHSCIILLLCRRGAFEECITRYREMAMKEPDNWWSSYLFALALAQSGKTEEAWQVTQDALQKFESNSYLSIMAGDLCAELGQCENALFYWDRSYKENPKDIACLYSKAFYMEKLGKTEKAIKAWEFILKWHQDNNVFSEHETDIVQEHLQKLRKGKGCISEDITG